MKLAKIILILATLAFGGFFLFKNAFLTYGQNRSAKNNPYANWRPTEEVKDIEYVGNQKCLNCHAEKEQLATPMAHALLKPADSKILDEFPSKPFRNGDYTYEVKKQGSEIIYTVSDGKDKQIFPILYSLGEGRKGQVYIFKYKNALYESRVSFYRGIKGLDFTVAQPHESPETLETAIGREIPAAEAQSCFSCHSTGAVKDKKLNIEHLDEAVSCEACHGAGGNHIKAVVSEDAKDTQIFNPAHLIPLEQTQEFCGACHVGVEKALNMSEDVDTIRFQPYRLFNSKKHDSNDPRLSCTACHNPHEKLEENPVAYDTKCFACHISSPQEKITKEHFAPACPVKTTNCVTCHMPKTDVPDMHFKFTDHWIRVVSANEKSKNKEEKLLTKKIRWGVLGAANIAVKKVIPAMQSGEFSEISAIASRNSEKAKRAAEDLQISKFYGSYEELLADSEIDAIYNPLPNDLHVEWTIKAAEKGKHVLCEKPLALTAREAEKLIAARDETGVKIQEAFMVRTHPQWLVVRDLIAQNRIGEVRAITMFFSYYNDDAENIRNKPENGGGALMDIGCYCINLSRYILGAEPRKVSALIERDETTKIDKLTSAMMDFPSCQATFTCSTQLVPYQRIHFFGAKGRIEVEIPVNIPTDAPTRIFVDNAGDLYEKNIETIEVPSANQYTVQGDLFSKAILDDSEQPISLEDSVKNMAVIEAIFRAAESGNREIPI